MAQFDSGGVTLAYDDIGPRDKGLPIVLLHGFTSNRNENWRRVGWYGALERRHVRFVAFDARGHGESGKPHDPAAYAGSQMIDDLFALMDHLEIPRADVMGYSMGAGLALGAALARPERIRDLIIGGVGNKFFDPPPPGHPMADAMAAETPDQISDPMLRSFRQFADDQGEDRLALAACSRALKDTLSPSGLAGLKPHTLVVAGARDELAGDPQALAALMPDARAVTLPGCDHFSAIPHASFKATVFDFMDGELD
jgi:pimeloyl-ACP methyl ester carboxylesterase